MYHECTHFSLSSKNSFTGFKCVIQFFFLKDTQLYSYISYYDIILIYHFIFFLISKESGQTSRGNIDIPTMLAPWETSIPHKGGGTRLKPSKEKTESKNKEINIQHIRERRQPNQSLHWMTHANRTSLWDI